MVLDIQSPLLWFSGRLLKQHLWVIFQKKISSGENEGIGNIKKLSRGNFNTFKTEGDRKFDDFQFCR